MNQFIEFLKNNEITDIILVGFVDVEKGIYEFYPNLKYLYIEMATKYVALESVNQYSLLKFCIKDDLCFEYEIDKDEQFDFVSDTEIDFEKALENAFTKQIEYKEKE